MPDELFRATHKNSHKYWIFDSNIMTIFLTVSAEVYYSKDII